MESKIYNDFKIDITSDVGNSVLIVVETNENNDTERDKFLNTSFSEKVELPTSTEKLRGMSFTNKVDKAIERCVKLCEEHLEKFTFFNMEAFVANYKKERGIGTETKEIA